MQQLSYIKDAAIKAATTAGFDLAGVAGVREYAELNFFSQWIAAGHAGEMNYMQARNEHGELKRASLGSALPWARSVIVCALNYNTAEPYSTEVNNPKTGWISRYAWSQQDYHKVVLTRLQQVENELHRALSENATDAAASLQTRCYVDTGPLVERVYAKYAGVGWVGKNTCVINQRLGSWFFLGVILTSLELAPDIPAADRCGTCTRCIEACPTDALLAPHILDSNRCISYLTIEKRGAIPEDLREGTGRHLFGCDICQDVCPWNRKPPATGEPQLQPRPELVSPALDWLAQMSGEEFASTFRGSPVRRAKLSGLRRNSVVAMGNSRDRNFIPTLEKLSADPDPVVAEHAHGALERLNS
jgi:epoxyqueuosine reductase